MHYCVLLVHSLWVQLWIEKYFTAKPGPDLRKHNFDLVDTKLLRNFFIHSPRAGVGDTQREASHKRRTKLVFCDVIRRNRYELTATRAVVYARAEYAVDNRDLA